MTATNHKFRTAAQLMSCSADQSCIAHGVWDADVALDLLAECEDSSEGGTDGLTDEYLGRTPEGVAWRVQLHREVECPETLRSA